MRRGINIIIFFFTVSFAFSQNRLTLEQCKEMALKNNIQAKNAGLAVEAAQQQKKQAFTKYFPSVSATGLGFAANKPMVSMDISSMVQPMMDALTPTIGWLMQQGAPLDPNAFSAMPTNIDMLKNGVIAGVMATQPVFAGGQIVNGNRLAKAGVEARQLQKQIADNQVSLETEKNFWKIVALKEKMKTIENSETMLARILSDVKSAVAAGLTTSNDRLRVELEQNKLESGKLKVENGLKMLKLSLGQKMGMPAEDFDIQEPDLEVITPDILQNDSSVQQRPEYKLLGKSVDIARLQRDMETGKNMPTVAVGAGYNYFRFDMNKADGMKNNFGMLFLNVTIPITDWWGGSHAIRQKKIELQQAENSKKDNTELLSLQIQNVHNEVNEAYQQVLIAKKSILSAEENLKISQDNYNAGIIILSDLLEAQNLLQQSRDQYTDAATEYYVKLAEYKNVTSAN